MKELNLNIDLDRMPDASKQGKSNSEIALLYLLNGMSLGSGRKNKDFHTKFYIMRKKLEEETKKNNGVIVLGKAELKWIDELWAKAEFPLDRTTNEIVCKITERLNQAKKIEETG